MDIRSFLREAGTADRANVSVETLRNWRRNGKGPAFYKISGKIYYDPKDVEKWLAECRQDPEAA